ncbi:MAG: hypothetical protein R2731_16025 [Nocardioides sp.]
MTMNGGSLRRVTSRPLSRPAAVPTAIAEQDGQPAGPALLGGELAPTIIESTMIVPTERSIPAVRMIRVWPIARAAMIAAC